NSSDFGVLARCLHPDANAVRASHTGHAENGQRLNDPCLQIMHIAPHIAPALVQIQHDIGDALAGAVKGILPAPARGIDGVSVAEKVFWSRAGARRIEGGTLHQPDMLWRVLCAD